LVRLDGGFLAQWDAENRKRGSRAALELAIAVWSRA
jgi:hypothetical protein